MTLNVAAASGGFTVSLSSNNSAVTVPASINIPAGQTSAGFTATVSSVSTTQSVTLTASAGGGTKTFTLQLGVDRANALYQRLQHRFRQCGLEHANHSVGDFDFDGDGVSDRQLGDSDRCRVRRLRRKFPVDAEPESDGHTEHAIRSDCGRVRDRHADHRQQLVNQPDDHREPERNGSRALRMLST